MKIIKMKHVFTYLYFLRCMTVVICAFLVNQIFVFMYFSSLFYSKVVIVLSLDIIKATWSEIAAYLNRMSDEQIKKFVEENKQILLSDGFKEKLRKASFSEITDFIRLIPVEFLEELLDKFYDAFEELINRDFSKLGILLSDVSKMHRKTFMKNMRTVIMEIVQKISLRDFIRALYNFVDIVREGFVNSIRNVLLGKDFAKKLIESPLEDVAELISVLPANFRNQFLKAHKETFLSDEFRKKLEKADVEEIIKFIRWLPSDLYNEFVSVHESVLKQKKIA